MCACEGDHAFISDVGLWGHYTALITRRMVERIHPRYHGTGAMVDIDMPAAAFALLVEGVDGVQVEGDDLGVTAIFPLDLFGTTVALTWGVWAGSAFPFKHSRVTHADRWGLCGDVRVRWFHHRVPNHGAIFFNYRMQVRDHREPTGWRTIA